MGRSKSLPDVIRDAIRNDGRTLYRLALDSNVNSAVLGRLMSGKRDVNLRTADRLCRALGLELRPRITKRGK